MKRLLRNVTVLAFPVFFCLGMHAQELFVFTEPASNMPSKSIGIRASNWFMYDATAHHMNYQLLPEIMWGASKNLMIHLDGFFTNQNGNFHGVGGGVYTKYRIYSADGINKHFRMAAFGRLSFNNSDIFQEEIDLTRNNSGYALGLIATQLLHKQAIAASISFNKANDNGTENKFPVSQSDQAVNASVSTGRLILPRKYLNYKQTNVNLMVELLGQHLLNSGKSYLDLAPAVQFIFNSQTRLDVGYKMQLYSNMQRMNPNAVMVRIEHLLFNVF
jgi:hypothetical protein